MVMIWIKCFPFSKKKKKGEAILHPLIQIICVSISLFHQGQDATCTEVFTTELFVLYSILGSVSIRIGWSGALTRKAGLIKLASPSLDIHYKNYHINRLWIKLTRCILLLPNRKQPTSQQNCKLTALIRDHTLPQIFRHNFYVLNCPC